jgi:serine/threonine protein kinase
MAKMFSSKYKHLPINNKNGEEMKDSSRSMNKGGRTNFTSSRKPQGSDSPTRRNDYSTIKSGDAQENRFDDTVKPSLAHRRLAHRRLERKALQFQEDDHAYDFFTEIETTDYPTSQQEKPSTSLHREEQVSSRKSGRQLEKELERTRRLLQCERAKKNALEGRVQDVENQLNQVKRSQVQEKDVHGIDDQRIRRLQDKVEDYGDELEKERTKGEELLNQMDELRKKNQELIDKMRLLMFQHIPSVSPRFKDIGAVDYGLEETSGRLGDYELGKLLGEGHYGMVQVGTNIKTNESYAIKILAKDRVQRFKDLQQVATEVTVLKRYNHSNILHLHEVIHAADNIYLVTELCSMDMHAYHSDIGLTEDDAKQVILGVLKPLEFLHNHGICHLDLKPENILLTKSVSLKNISHEHVRLCDFGLVNMAKHPEQSKEVFRQGYACGTPGFFAPEMVLKREFEGRMADMWSLGCILLEVTLGFTQEWMDSYDRIGKEEGAFKAGLQSCLDDIARDKYPLHQNLLDIIHRCLDLEPQQRITSIDALAHAWLEPIFIADKHREHSAQPRQDIVDQRKRTPHPWTRHEQGWRDSKSHPDRRAPTPVASCDVLC